MLPQPRRHSSVFAHRLPRHTIGPAVSRSSTRPSTPTLRKKTLPEVKFPSRRWKSARRLDPRLDLTFHRRFIHGIHTTQAPTTKLDGATKPDGATFDRYRVPPWSPIRVRFWRIEGASKVSKPPRSSRNMFATLQAARLFESRRFLSDTVFSEPQSSVSIRQVNTQVTYAQISDR